METYSKKDSNLLDKMRRKKMNDFSKIRKGSVHNAYVRRNLGSIPSKFDNFIFKLPEESKTNLSDVIKPMMVHDENLRFRKDIFKCEHKSWNNFGSGNSIELRGNTIKFMVNNSLKEGKRNTSEFDSNNIESFKTLYSNSNNSTNHTFYKNNNNYSKEMNKDNISSSDKNDLSERSKNISSLLNLESKNKNLIQNQSKSLTNIFSKEERYDNYHYKRQILSKYYPGPGEYEQDEFTDNIYQKYHFRYNSLFKLKSSFPLIKRRETTYKVGPGSYLRNTFRQNAILGTFPKAEKNKVDSKQKQESKDDDYIDMEYPELPGAINIKDKDKLSYFFIRKKKKEENLEKKCGIGDKDEIKKRNDSNIYIESEIKPRWGTKEKTKDFNNDWINRSLEKKIKEEKKKGNIIEQDEIHKAAENKDKQDVIYWAKMAIESIKKSKEDVKKKKDAFTFSKIPKNKKEEKHVPGPSYYEPDKILRAIKQKKEFNFNMEMNWI